tara:strand:+ start:324 stop:512 length:189 start_codon:yes stop_codon:yes gene_type:complete
MSKSILDAMGSRRIWDEQSWEAGFKAGFTAGIYDHVMAMVNDLPIEVEPFNGDIPRESVNER